MAVNPRPPYSVGQFSPNQPFSPDLATKRGELPALVFEAVLGHLGSQLRGDVLHKEQPYFGDPGMLLVVELEVHIGDSIANVTGVEGSSPVASLRFAHHRNSG